MKKKDMAVKMSKASFVKEHKNLLNVLKTGKGLKKEYKQQKKELKRISPW